MYLQMRFNPRLTADASTIQAGQTVKIYAAVKDETGFNTAGTPMRVSLDCCIAKSLE